MFYIFPRMVPVLGSRDSPSTDSRSALAYVSWAVMPKAHPFAQDLMQEALSNNGSHVERFLSPTIFLS